MILQRRLLKTILEGLLDSPLVLVAGPPRSGKTILAGQLARASAGQALLLDARQGGSRNLLLEPELSLGELSSAAGGGGSAASRYLVVDNADRDGAILDSLSAALHGPAGGERRARSPALARAVLLGTAFPACEGALRLELCPLGLQELGREARSPHWLRGGYPEAFFAPSDAAAFAFLDEAIDRMTEARLAGAGLPWAPGRTRSLLSMLALSQGGAFNENAAARSLGVTRPTVSRSIGALVQAGLLRELPSLPSPRGKRCRLSPSLYIRDSGLLHALLGVSTMRALLGHPLLAASYEGYVVEQALVLLPPGLEARGYRTQDGAGLELVFLREGRVVAGAALRWARGGRAVPRGARLAAADLGLARPWLVLPEAEEAEDEGGFLRMGVGLFLERLASL